MGYNEMDKVWDCSQASKTDKLVLLAIARRYSPGKGAWPSQKALAKACGVSERAIRSSIARLQELGELEWVSGSNSSGKANRYFISFVETKTSAENTKTSAIVSKTSGESDKNFRLLNILNKNIYILNANKVSVFSKSYDSDCFRVSFAFVSQFVKVGVTAELEGVMARFEGHNVYRLAKSSDQVLHNWWVWLQNEYSGHGYSVNNEGVLGVVVTEGKNK
ncbi:Helix-turn-helix domain containing protein [uncultured Caudovirales phage]|uniref:Helix-turn-helix domain containing protein n=1 Tax=uncultured Caudovirales phage TaxID=2100421 RepID=A0A6J7WKZ0_9CAUD|nr:Helix-turn-helix domain containing protein [uncultured Caudovirales phage]